MGNRATIIFTDGKKSFSPAVYLHWSGGPESVYAFLAELDRRKVRADQEYECARFIQLVGEFFDQDKIGSLSLGVTNGPKSDDLEELARVPTDKGDNGIYLVNRTNGPMTVRRFKEHVQFLNDKDTKITMTEDPQETVLQEQEQANHHENQIEFAAIYRKIQGKRKIEV